VELVPLYHPVRPLVAGGGPRTYGTDDCAEEASHEPGEHDQPQAERHVRPPTCKDREIQGRDVDSENTCRRDKGQEARPALLTRQIALICRRKRSQKLSSVSIGVLWSNHT
jgi:hypothetical protein